MNSRVAKLIEALAANHKLPLEDYEYLIQHRSDAAAEELGKRAVKVRQEIYGNSVYVRGLIEITNICKNNCLYCGIRRSNYSCQRYRLSEEQILACC